MKAHHRVIDTTILLRTGGVVLLTQELARLLKALVFDDHGQRI
jgi:hypothetical protein